MEIRKLRKKDNKKAIQFAIDGMHFNWYLKSKFLLKLYGRYFWYDELNRATQVIAAYEGEEFAGVLLAEMKGEEKTHASAGKKIYVGLFDILQKIFYGGGVGEYDQANKELFDEYRKNNEPDGQIVFLAVDPKIKDKGVGSRLLKELEYREKGKNIYLYTDNACTYQFYEHRGFHCSGEKNVILNIGKKKVPLTCFLYGKKIEE